MQYFTKQPTKLDSLLQTIHTLQNELITIGNKEGLNSLYTIRLSQELDQYIITYQKLLQQKSK